ncbi:MAG: ABC transporter ATP-binding protein [Candidatus Omnitrophica bacterium]|nr:ABC transporter ATP-binding protein [Candidatus Omnitrophota bacterium]
MSDDFIFQIQNVSRAFAIRQGILRKGPKFKAVDNLNLDLCRGGLYALVGESGSGKSTLAKMLAGLLKPTEGKILFKKQDLQKVLKKNREAYYQKVQIIFQNPYLALDPRWKIKTILEEGIQNLSAAERNQRVAEALEKVHLKKEYLMRKPQALSGGERQRVAIARALVMRPEFLILDEPTSQLDVSVQAQIIGLLKALRPSFKAGMLFISHDLALVSQLTEDWIVLYEGRVVEMGKKNQILSSPKAPYTQKLLQSVISTPYFSG